MSKKFIKSLIRPKEQGVLRFTINLLSAHNFYRVVKGRVINNPMGRWQVWRNNTGAVRTESGGFMRIGFTGSADIIGIARDGKFIGIECKRDEKASLSPAQEAFAEICQPGYHFRVDSVEDAIRVQKFLLEI